MEAGGCCAEGRASESAGEIDGKGLARAWMREFGVWLDERVWRVAG